MRPVDPRIEPLLANLASEHGFPTDAIDTIRQAINESPYLTNLLADVATNGHVEHIALSHDKHSGGVNPLRLAEARSETFSYPFPRRFHENIGNPPILAAAKSGAMRSLRSS